MILTKEQIEEYKTKLYNKRAEIVKALQDPAVEGIWKGVVDKYSDQAHFLYEIIQNADDAGATEARFILGDTELVFIHNGKRLFSISDVDTERIDKKRESLGDINAITSVGQSNKIDPAKIGKFGMGFKSVFQYTSSPIVYDNNFRFKITDYMVPNWLNSDYAGRKPNETVFIFPFDRHDITPTQAKTEILEKLKNLVLPVMFLHSMEKIEYECDAVRGEYSKKCLESEEFEGTSAKKYEIVNGSQISKSYLWHFSKMSSEGFTYSVCYFVDNKGKLIPKSNYPAFCFFPTKVTTHLNFLIHAPFLLTDSREGIKANASHNIEMINLLAKLSADALEYFVKIGDKQQIRLIDDDIINIIPIQKSLFEVNKTNEISFDQFYDEIRNKLKYGLLPTNDGYTSANKACWADTSSILQVFDQSKIVDRKWIFYTKTGARNHAELDKYLKEMGVVYLKLEDLIKRIQADFIEKQSLEWLYSLYEIIVVNKEAVKASKTAPIFYNTEHKICPAFGLNGEENLYLSSPNSDGYNVVLPELESNEYAKKLLNELGVSKPVLKDKIYKKILKKSEFNEIDDFKDFLDYFIECENNREEAEKKNFIDKIKNKAFISVVNANGDDLGKAASNTFIYLMNAELKIYFSASNDIKFFNIEKYKQILSVQEYNRLNSFLTDLGVSPFAIYAKKETDGRLYPGIHPRSTGNKKYFQYFVTGAFEFLDEVVKSQNIEYSQILLNQLSHAYSYEVSLRRPLFYYKCEYFYRKLLFTTVDDPKAKRFKEEKWLVDNSKNFVSPNETFLQRLSENYNISDPNIKDFLTIYLGIKKEHSAYDNLNPDIRKKVELSDLLEKYGVSDISENEIALIKELREKKSEVNNQPAEGNETEPHGENTSRVTTDKKTDNNSDEGGENQEISPKRRISKEIVKLAEAMVTEKANAIQVSSFSEDDDADEDEYTKATVDYTKKIQKIKDKCAVEINDLEQYEDAQKQAIESKRYSYRWFSALLKLEMLSSNENNSNSREVSITFAKVKRDCESKKTLILEQPNKNIPSVVEELYGINLTLRMRDGSDKLLPFEAASIRSFSLKVMLMHADQLLDLNLDQVASASIVAKSPVFLLQELQKQFDAFSFNPDFDMKASLCENIKFTFGPPGTGKTTFLARNIIKELVKNNENIKILVLTPTNKAADVITTRTIDVMLDDSYKNWLTRFGVTNDETLEERGIFCSKNYDIEKHNQCVMVTTIARYPYDGMKCEGKEDLLLRNVKWDYIVIDEASMIPLVQIIYVLYSQKPKQFIIAGDPFQIEPTTAIDMWKDENIYKMVKLDSFTNIHTEPHKYEIELLKTQYRSIPSVGKIFSALTYDNSLNHYRSEESQKNLNIEEYLSYSSLNLIKFPVHRFESIYRSKKLNKSNYQIYSALFAYEFTCYLARKIAEKNPSEKFKIGVISPYGAQAKLINNLLLAEKFPDTISILCGTIHGFQGDECDVLITVFNAPEGMSNTKNMFLNHQNIINVAISRAKDYLFVLMPDNNTNKIDNLWLIKNVEKLMKSNPSCTEIDSHELEKRMFGNEVYLEENTFSTGHQSVNVYGVPEKKYEIRSEEDAIDIQIHKESHNDRFVHQT